MGLFSGIFGAIGSVFGGPLGGALGGLAGGLFDRGEEQDALDDRADAANGMELERWKMTNKANKRAATVSYMRDIKTMKRTDRMNDQNVRAAQRWQAKQALKAWDRTDKSALRARRWAKEDYRQQKADVGNQFVRLRAAAEKAGYNPLSVLGAGSGMLSPAGGITSSSYGAASGVGAAPVSGFAASTPMAGYGAPVHVAPLASNDAIEGLVGELGRELTGEAALDRQRNAIAEEIATIELERLRGGFPSQSFGLPAMGAYAAPTPHSRMSGTAEQVGEVSPTAMAAATAAENEGVPVEVEPSEMGSLYDYVIVDGKKRWVPKDEIEDYVSRMAIVHWQETQDKFRDMGAAISGGISKAGSALSSYWEQGDNERNFIPSLTPGLPMQSFPNDWENHPRLGGL